MRRDLEEFVSFLGRTLTKASARTMFFVILLYLLAILVFLAHLTVLRKKLNQEIDLPESLRGNAELL